MPDTWVFTRTILQAPKSRQRVRLNATIPPTVGDSIWNAHWEEGHYSRAWIVSGSIYVGFAEGAVPPFEFTAAAITTGDATEPHIVVHPNGWLTVVYTRSGADVMRAVSYDHGRDFTVPAVAIAGGTHPVVCCSPEGAIIVAAYVSGKLTYTYQSAGDASPSAATIAKDDTGSDFTLTDNQFGLSRGYAADSPWVLACMKQGESDISEWESWDLESPPSLGAATFKRKT
jgi:hypothetical protein